jgi:hydrogenase maturation factor HypF (carbamoyltransferase family)
MAAIRLAGLVGLVGLGALLAIIVAVLSVLTYGSLSTRVLRAYGVMSPCEGMYAVIVETSRGTVLMNSDNESDPDMAALKDEVLALPQEKRHTIIVPCAERVQGA